MFACPPLFLQLLLTRFKRAHSYTSSSNALRQLLLGVFGPPTESALSFHSTVEGTDTSHPSPVLSDDLQTPQCFILQSTSACVQRLWDCALHISFLACSRLPDWLSLGNWHFLSTLVYELLVIMPFSLSSSGPARKEKNGLHRAGLQRGLSGDVCRVLGCMRLRPPQKPASATSSSPRQ